MRRLDIFIRLVSSLSLVAGARTASAEDFEFEVPVQVSKIDPAFTQGRVLCRVMGVGHDTTGLTPFASVLIASGNATFALVQGDFNGTVSVRFNAGRPQHDPADGRSWSCELGFVSAGGSVGACVAGVADPLTGTPGKVPEVLKLDPKSLKACVNGTISTAR